jgi:uncharacterized oligopeptide transporter (OPT) family protein
MRKHMIIKQNLPFPSGTATAVVLVRLHEARRDGMRRARSLLISMVASGVFIVLTFFVPVGPVVDAASVVSFKTIRCADVRCCTMFPSSWRLASLLHIPRGFIFNCHLRLLVRATFVAPSYLVVLC